MAIEPVGLSLNLGAQRVMRAQVDGHDMAVWRAASLSVQAWGNRCPHRGMRLSHGFVRGDSLACAYHGWHYNCEAICHYIPAHPDLEPPESIKPVVFKVIEEQGVLFVSTDGSAVEDTGTTSLPDGYVGLRSITMECQLEAVVTAFKASPPQAQNGSQMLIRVDEHTGHPKAITFSSSDTEEGVIVLFQQAEPAVINVHVLVSASTSIDAQIAHSRWCESVRRAAEETGS